MSDIRDQILTFNLLQKAGYLALIMSTGWDSNNYKKLIYTTGSDTFTTENKKRLLTRSLMNSFEIPLQQLVQRLVTNDDGETSVETVSSKSYSMPLIELLDGWQLNSNVLSDYQLLRWRDLDQVETQVDTTTSIQKNYISKWNVLTNLYGYNYESYSHKTVTTGGTDVSTCEVTGLQLLAYPPDGTSVAAKYDYHWSITVQFKAGTYSNGMSIMGPTTFSGVFKKGSTGYMYSDAIDVTFYGVSNPETIFKLGGYDFISAKCYYETTVTT